MDNTVEVQELGKVMITPKGEYSLSKSYEILDAVSYNGSSYVSKINDNTSVPTSDAWQLLAQKGDTYELSEEDLQRIAEQITSNANSAFNQNVKEKTDSFNSNANSKTEAYNTNATEKLGTYNSNHTAKLKEYNDNATSKLSAYNTNTVTKTTEYNSNHTNKLNAYNTNADSKIEEYNTNANNKILEYDKHSEELRNMAISTDNELERVKNEILDTGSASDSFVHVEDSCMAKIKELEIEGVINQKTTTGKNLLPNNATSQTINGVTYTVNSDGSVYAKGTAIARSEFTIYNKPFTLNANTEYKFQTDILMIISTTTSGYISGTKGQTFTSESEISVLSVYIRVESGASIDKTIYPMITLVDANDAYEPYTGGQPSPSPKFPQEIKTITNSLKVTSCGKNLFNVSVPTTTRGGITVSQDDNGIHVQGTSTNIVNFLFPTKILNRLAGKTITLTCADLTNSNIQNISFKSPATNTVYCAIDQNVKSRTYKLPIKIADDTVFSIYILNNMTINSTLKIQVEIGNKSEYENYVESLIEANLPEGEFIGYVNSSNRDILRFKYNEEDRLYHQILNKFIKKVIIDGTKGSISMPTSNRFNIDNALDDYLKTSSSYGTYAFCTNYIVVPQAGSNSDFDNFAINYDYALDFGGGTANNIRIKNIKFSNIEDFKNDLKLHPIILYYILKPESRYELDIGTIKMPLSYKEITNIFTNNDLLPKITAKYYRTFEKTIQNMQINEKSLKQEITDLNNNISDITKRLEALESANASTVEESEA